MKFSYRLLLLVAAHGLTAYADSGKIKDKYRYLLNQEVLEHSDSHKELGQAHLFMREGIRVLYLKGDRFEMAYQHGRLLRDVIPVGAMPKIATMIENAARNSFPNIPQVVNPIIDGIYKNYTRALITHAAENLGVTYDEYIVEGYGLAAGSGLQVDQVVYSFLTPEILQVILGQQMKSAKNYPAPTAINECTDFAVPPHRTESGGFVIGRNTDYSLNGYFDKYPTVIYYNPTDGAQRYMSITSAGVHTAGVVGYNESGLFLGVHTIPTWDTSSKGHPVFDVAQHILRYAKNFDQAVDIFRKYLPGAGWTYTLVSTKENRSASIELSNSKLSVRETTGLEHIQSNHFSTSTMKSRNLDINASINEDTHARYKRTEELLKAKFANFTPRDAVKILADKLDPLSREIRGVGNVVATHFTVTSAVIDTGRQSLYFANGLAPTSLTPFIELPLIEKFKLESFLDEKYDSIIENSYHTTNPYESQAEQLYIAAKNSFEIDLNSKQAAQILQSAVETDPRNFAYLYMLGLMQFKSGAPDRAKETLERCANVANGHHKLSCKYFAARISASQGERDEALNGFESVISEADPTREAPLLRATKANLKKLKRTGFVRFSPDTLSIFMPEAEVLAY